VIWESVVVGLVLVLVGAGLALGGPRLAAQEHVMLGDEDPTEAIRRRNYRLVGAGVAGFGAVLVVQGVLR
jgi:hypothetical protein